MKRKRSEMKTRKLIILALGVVAVVLGIGLHLAWRGQHFQASKAIDLESFREELKERVNSGEMTPEEAHVHLEVAKQEGRFKTKESKELKAFVEELTKAVEKGELTEAEAKTRYAEAANENDEKTIHK